MKKIIMVALAALIIFGAAACSNNNPLTDPSSPIGPNSPTGPLNPSNPNSPIHQDRFTADEATGAIIDVINGLDKPRSRQILMPFLPRLYRISRAHL